MAAFISCDRITPEADEAVIGFGAGIPTKAVTEEFSVGSTFSVRGAYTAGTSYSGTATNVFEGTTVTMSVKSPQEWTYSPKKSWRSSSVFRFRAFSPAGAGVTFTDDFTSQAELAGFEVSSVVDSQTDLLMSDLSEVPVSSEGLPTGTSASGKAVIMNFKHILCRVKLQVEKDSGDPDEFEISSIQLTGMKNKGDFISTSSDNGASWTGAWDVSSGSVLTCTKAFSPALEVTSSPTQIWTDGLMLIPQTLGSDVKVVVNYSVTHGSKVYPKTSIHTLPATDVPAWQPGVVYTYRLKMDENYDIIFATTTPSIEEWGTAQASGTVIIK